MYSHKTQVTASHIGIDGYQTPMSVLSMLQDCSQLWLDSQPVMKEYLADNGLAMILASRQVDFLHRAPYATHLTAKTSVYDCNGYTGYRNTALYGPGDVPYVKSWSLGLFVNSATGKPARLPKSVLSSILYDEKLPMEYLDKRIDLPDAEPRVHPSIGVQRADIDFNQHMNNTQYIRIACEYLPEEAVLSRLRVEYKIPAKYGDWLTPLVYKSKDDPDTLCVVLNNEKEDHPFAIVELSVSRKCQTE